MANVLGEMTVRIVGDNRDLSNTINSTEKKAKGLGSSMSKIFKGIGFAVAIAGVGKVAKQLILAASDAEETRNKFNVVFKDIALEAEASAKNLSQNFGLSGNAARTLLSDTGDLLTGFGFTQEASLDLSNQVNELAVDLASFTNFSGGAAGASAALTKALLGEREGVKSLGISILEADVKAKVLEMTQQGVTFETERQAKAYATMQIALEQSKNAIGDFQRSSASFANQTRQTSAKIEDLQVALGEKLLPVANVGVGLFNDLLDSTLGAAEGMGDFVSSADGIDKISSTFGVIAGTFEVLKGFVVSLFTPIKEAITNILSPLGELKSETNGASVAFSALGTITQLITGALDIYSTIVGGVVENTVNLVNTIKAAGGVVGDFFGLITGSTTLKEFKQTVAETGDVFKTFASGIIKNTVGAFDVIAENVFDFGAAATEAADEYEKSFTIAAKIVEDKVAASLKESGKLQEDLTDTVIAETDKRTDAQIKAGEDALKAQEDINKKRVDAEKQTSDLIAQTVKEQINAQIDNAHELAGLLASLATALADKQIAEIDRVLQADLDAVDARYGATIDSLTALSEAEKAFAAGERAIKIAELRASSEEIDKLELAALFAKEDRIAALTEVEKKSADAKAALELAAAKKSAKLRFDGEMTAWSLSKLSTIAAGAQAAVSSFGSLAGIPIVGPGLGLAAAISAGILTGVQVGIINANKPVMQSFAGGGVVAGTSFTGDRVQAMVNSREMILNDAQQARLFSMANGSTTNNNNNNQSVNVNALFALGNDAKIREAAKVMFPALIAEGNRRGTSII